MVRISTKYIGGKRCELVHEQSASVIRTDAPKDNNGKGELFSPTDLIAAATVSCMLTVLGINAEKDGLSIDGSTATVEKEMGIDPRRIVKLRINMQLPRSLTREQREKLEALALNCPAKQSLNKDIQVAVTFSYEL